MNNYTEFKKLLEQIKNTNQKPSLLLHSCCAPCSSHVLTLLSEYFNITLLYYNPNIYPNEEYVNRVEEQIRLIKELGLGIKFIEGEYNHQEFLDLVKGYEDLEEKGYRCYLCYEMRIKYTSIKAKEYGFDYFTTTLSISPHKNSDWINEIGLKYENENTKFLYSNFKKEEGYKKSIILSKKYDLYRQDYCGCEFSQKMSK